MKWMYVSQRKGIELFELSYSHLFNCISYSEKYLKELEYEFKTRDKKTDKVRYYQSYFHFCFDMTRNKKLLNKPTKLVTIKQRQIKRWAVLILFLEREWDWRNKYPEYKKLCENITPVVSNIKIVNDITFLSEFADWLDEHERDEKGFATVKRKIIRRIDSIKKEIEKRQKQANEMSKKIIVQQQHTFYPSFEDPRKFIRGDTF